MRPAASTSSRGIGPAAPARAVDDRLEVGRDVGDDVVVEVMEATVGEFRKGSEFKIQDISSPQEHIEWVRCMSLSRVEAGDKSVGCTVVGCWHQ